MNQGTEEGILTSALVLTALFLSCHWGRGRRGRRERPTLFSLEPRSGQRRLGTGAAPAWEQHPREGRDAEGGRTCRSPTAGPGHPAGLRAPSCALYQVRGPGSTEKAKEGSRLSTFGS